MKKKAKIPQKTVAMITENWQDIQGLHAKEFLKKINSICFDIYNSYEKGKFTLSELQCLSEILRACIQCKSVSSRYNILLSKIIAEQLNISGNTEYNILIKKNGKIPVESGSIIIFDSENKDIINNDLNNHQYSNKALLQQINAGHLAAIGTGGDGIFDVQLRVIDAKIPLVSPKEFQFVKASSQKTILHCSSGNIMIGDLSSLNFNVASISATIAAGFYMVQTFYFFIPNKISSFYIVLCKTNENKSVELNHLDELMNF